jgi:hypothetical protein
MKKTSRPENRAPLASLTLSRTSVRVLTDERLHGIAAGTSHNCTKSEVSECAADPRRDEEN